METGVCAEGEENVSGAGFLLQLGLDVPGSLEGPQAALHNVSLADEG